MRTARGSDQAGFVLKVAPAKHPVRVSDEERHQRRLNKVKALKAHFQ